MGILFMFGTGFLATLLLEKFRNKTLSHTSLFFLFMFVCALICYLANGSLNFLFWGTIWLPSLLIAKRLLKANINPNSKSAKRV
jgi:hypothetical protein